MCIDHCQAILITLELIIYYIKIMYPSGRENTYDAVGPKGTPAVSDQVAMEANPAYGVCAQKQ